MQYSEFTQRLTKKQNAPSFEEYTEWIEPVYTYHPMFGNVDDPKLLAAFIYEKYGLTIFKAIRSEAIKGDEIQSRLMNLSRNERKIDKLGEAFEDARGLLSTALVEQMAAELNVLQKRFADSKTEAEADWARYKEVTDPYAEDIIGAFNEKYGKTEK